MTKIGIMIEGQEDLTWERFFRLAQAVEDLGFESLFRSDHLTGLGGHTQRRVLPLWPALTALALRTQRIRFGPMVCSMTFRNPALLAKEAAAVDFLSGGRLDLGLGTGWHEGEHRMYGINFPPFSARLEMLDEGAHVVKALWQGTPVTFTGKHYRLEAAESYPLPAQPAPVLIIGGKSERTLQLVAKHASEWNCVYADVALFRQKSAYLDEQCRAIGRDPATICHSLMLPFVVATDPKIAQRRVEAAHAMFAHLPTSVADWHAANYFGTTPQRLVEQINAFVEAGVARFMLQLNDLDDIEMLELLAREVLPHVK
jgi:F420-dependent oxidoreductase-like protein